MDSSPASSHGHRIARLFEGAHDRVCIISPFIKLSPFVSLLDVIPPKVHVKCVTRWIPQEIANGVSDPDILFALQQRDSWELSLVDSLHAKLYVADEACLVGSANITGAALGYTYHTNVEALVLTSVSDPDIASTLELIALLERPATEALLESVKVFAENVGDVAVYKAGRLAWFPRSRQPEKAFSYYREPPRGFLTQADRTLLRDIASINIAPGLDEMEFAKAVCELLSEISIIEDVVTSATDVTLTYGDALLKLELLTTEEQAPKELWNALILWAAHFFQDKIMLQEITEFALRKATPLG